MMNDRLFINLSNHPSSTWPDEQLEAAKCYGTLEDMPFPPVPPEASHEQVQAMAAAIVEALPKDGRVTLHVMGEMTLVYAIVERCKAQGISCVASTTERIVTTAPGHVKTSTFRFVRFREY